MVSLADLVARLQAAMPAKNGVPADYEQIVKDAILQLSQDVPLVRSGTLSIVHGESTYELPADYLRMISLPELGRGPSGGVIVTDDGLVSVPGGWHESYTIMGNSIIFEPVPGYTLQRRYQYAAVYLLDEDENYPTLTDNLARIALLYARYLVMTEQAMAVADSGWKYQIGDEMVDKSNQSKSIATQANILLNQYHLAISRGSYGMRAQYGSEELPAWV